MERRDFDCSRTFNDAVGERRTLPFLGASAPDEGRKLPFLAAPCDAGRPPEAPDAGRKFTTSLASITLEVDSLRVAPTEDCLFVAPTEDPLRSACSDGSRASPPPTRDTASCCWRVDALVRRSVDERRVWRLCSSAPLIRLSAPSEFLCANFGLSTPSASFCAPQASSRSSFGTAAILLSIS